MGSASPPPCLSGSGLQVLSPARPGAHSCPLLPERQKTPPRCWGLGDGVMCKPAPPPAPLTAPPPPSKGKGGTTAVELAGAGCNFSHRAGLPGWKQFSH